MAHVRQLGYVGLEVSDLRRWEAYAVDVLGLQVAHRADDGALALRIDDYAQRVTLHPGKADDLAYLGFEVASEAELEEIGQRLARADLKVAEGGQELRAARRVARLVELDDPNGIPVELYLGASIAREPFRSGAGVSGFVTGDEGLGHVVLHAKDALATKRFYVDLLGLKVSDRVCIPTGDGAALEVTFLHANARHHSVAFVQLPVPKRLNHLMLEVDSEDDVGRARDRAVEAGVAVVRDLGKHPNDRMLSFYSTSPSGFEVEIGAGARKIDEATWREHTYDQVSLWGHQPRPQA
jgi:2,3-dihydroxybiphenyl 1,2-dioxygenase